MGRGGVAREGAKKTWEGEGSREGAKPRRSGEGEVSREGAKPRRTGRRGRRRRFHAKAWGREDVGKGRCHAKAWGREEVGKREVAGEGARWRGMAGFWNGGRERGEDDGWGCVGLQLWVEAVAVGFDRGVRVVGWWWPVAGGRRLSL